MSNNTNTTSICWFCKNARADRCAWISRQEKVWDKATEKQCLLENDRGYLPLWTVQECQHFSPGKGWKQDNKQKSSATRENKKAARENKKATKRPYTQREDAFIINMREQGMSCGEIAEKLNRTRNAIYQRIARLTEMEMRERGEVEKVDEKNCVGAAR